MLGMEDSCEYLLGTFRAALSSQADNGKAGNGQAGNGQAGNGQSMEGEYSSGEDEDDRFWSRTSDADLAGQGHR
jgi:hypothetical protein